MFMIFTTKDTSVLPYLITSLAVQFLGCVIWYLKNSEAEKKVRIEAEMERMKLVSKNAVTTIIDKVKSDIEDVESEPDTFYKGNDDSVAVNTGVLPTVGGGFGCDNSDSEPIEINDDGSVG